MTITESNLASYSKPVSQRFQEELNNRLTALWLVKKFISASTYVPFNIVQKADDYYLR